MESTIRFTGLDSYQCKQLNHVSTGIKSIVEYDANKEGDRQAKIKALDEYKFSKNSNTWQEYLEKEFPAKGTRTNMQDINKEKICQKEKTEKKIINKKDQKTKK
jgi:hypothetical protein